MVNEVSDGPPADPTSVGAGLRRDDDRPTEIRVRGHFDEDPDEWTQSLRAIDQAPDVHPNPWAWIGTTSDETHLVDIGDHRVTAVLVTIDAERWLPDTLAGLAALEHRPARVIAIDNEAATPARRLLRRALETEVLDALYEGERDFGFGQAVASALRQDRWHPTSAGAPADVRSDALIAAGLDDDLPRPLFVDEESLPTRSGSRRGSWAAELVADDPGVDEVPATVDDATAENDATARERRDS